MLIAASPLPAVGPVGPSDPAVRAAFTQAALHAALASEPVRVRAALAASSLEQVLDASRSAWIPVEIDMDVTEAITSVLGPDRSTEFWRKSLVDAMRSPILGPVVDGVVAVFGLAPESLLRWTPRAWNAVYRNCGTMTVLERGLREGRVAFDDITPVLLRSGAFIEALRASFEAVFTLCRVHGEVQVETLDVASRRAVYAFSWTARPRRR